MSAAPTSAFPGLKLRTTHRHSTATASMQPCAWSVYSLNELPNEMTQKTHRSLCGQEGRAHVVPKIDAHGSYIRTVSLTCDWGEGFQ